jgi:hypothetical protein
MTNIYSKTDAGGNLGHLYRGNCQAVLQIVSFTCLRYICFRRSGNPSLQRRPNMGEKYNRKAKSLGLLCENFINAYGDGSVDVISLDDASERLDVPRRRLYDIVNVLESVQIVSRQQKNRYALTSKPVLVSLFLASGEL